MKANDMKTVATKVDDETLSGLESLAQETGLKISDLLRLAIRDLLTSYKLTGKIELGRAAEPQPEGGEAA